MCDSGRLNYKFINDPNRLTVPTVKSTAIGERFSLTWTEATHQVAERLQAAKAKGAGSIAAVASARATTEELFLFNKLAREVLGAELVDCVARIEQGDKFLLNADRNPNVNGAKLAGITAEPVGGRIALMAEAIKAGKIKALVVLGENVAKHGIPEDLLARLELLVVIDTLPNKATELAHYVLPGATFAEKRGTFVNAKGRLQRFNTAMPSPGIARPEWQTLAALLNELGADGGYLTIEDVFADMARRLPALVGLNLSKIGDMGVELKWEGEAPAEPASPETTAARREPRPPEEVKR